MYEYKFKLNEKYINEKDLNENEINKEDKEADFKGSESPKCIRGPTEYKRGVFRELKRVPEDSEERLSMLKEKPDSNGEAFHESTLESQNAKIYIGKISKDKKVLLSARENDYTKNVNTYKRNAIDLQRASSLFRRGHTTYAENIDEAFCHFVSETDPSGSFLNYLEAAAKQSETREITEIFPFLNIFDDIELLNKLLNERNKIDSSESIEQLTLQIDEVRQRIYDNQLKKAQFTKRIEQLFESEPHEEKGTDKEKEFWLWLWLKKLLAYLLEEIDEAEN